MMAYAHGHNHNNAGMGVLLLGFIAYSSFKAIAWVIRFFSGTPLEWLLDFLTACKRVFTNL
jgi:hypothetical protein